MIYLAGILQREEHAVQYISNWVQEEQKAYGGQSNSVALHWKLAMYLTIVNPKFTEYWRIGDSALETLEQGIDGFGQFGKHKVYIVRSFDVDRDHGPIDLLKRRVVYGEYYIMYEYFIPSSFLSISLLLSPFLLSLRQFVSFLASTSWIGGILLPTGLGELSGLSEMAISS